MQNLRCLVLVAGGAALAAAVLYDATLVTQAIGLPVEGGEAIVVLAALSLAMVLFVAAGLRWRKAAKAAA